MISNVFIFEVFENLLHSPLIEYNNDYWKTSESLWWYYKDEPFLTDDCVINFTTNDNSDSW